MTFEPPTSNNCTQVFADVASARLAHPSVAGELLHANQPSEQEATSLESVSSSGNTPGGESVEFSKSADSGCNNVVNKEPVVPLPLETGDASDDQDTDVEIVKQIFSRRARKAKCNQTVLGGRNTEASNTPLGQKKTVSRFQKLHRHYLKRDVLSQLARSTKTRFVLPPTGKYPLIDTLSKLHVQPETLYCATGEPCADFDEMSQEEVHAKVEKLATEVEGILEHALQVPTPEKLNPLLQRLREEQAKLNRLKVEAAAEDAKLQPIKNILKFEKMLVSLCTSQVLATKLICSCDAKLYRPGKHRKGIKIMVPHLIYCEDLSENMQDEADWKRTIKSLTKQNTILRELQTGVSGFTDSGLIRECRSVAQEFLKKANDLALIIGSEREKERECVSSRRSSSNTHGMPNRHGEVSGTKHFDANDDMSAVNCAFNGQTGDSATVYSCGFLQRLEPVAIETRSKATAPREQNDDGMRPAQLERKAFEEVGIGPIQTGFEEAILNSSTFCAHNDGSQAAAVEVQLEHNGSVEPMEIDAEGGKLGQETDVVRQKFQVALSDTETDHSKSMDVVHSNSAVQFAPSVTDGAETVPNMIQEAAVKTEQLISVAAESVRDKCLCLAPICVAPKTQQSEAAGTVFAPSLEEVMLQPDAQGSQGALLSAAALRCSSTTQLQQLSSSPRVQDARLSDPQTIMSDGHAVSVAPHGSDDCPLLAQPDAAAQHQEHQEDSARPEDRPLTLTERLQQNVPEPIPKCSCLKQGKLFCLLHVEYLCVGGTRFHTRQVFCWTFLLSFLPR